MRIESDLKLDFSDVLIKPKRSALVSREAVNLRRTFFNESWTGIPIIAANMDTTGTFEMAKALAKHKICTALHKYYSVKELVDFFKKNHEIRDYVFYSIGITDTDTEKLTKVDKKLGELAPTNLCIDVANGYIEPFAKYVATTRENFPNRKILAGNVVTGEMTEHILLAGADIVKIGIGPGSVCTTRKIAGVGYPQLSAIIECADAAHGLSGLICGDGGIQVPGDLGKAFGAGADFVMIGGMFAGHDECAGEIVKEKGRKTPTHMRFYGMSSSEAMERHLGGVAAHRSSEGKSVLVPYRGVVNETVKTMLGGIRSTCTYTGSLTLKELSKRTTFIMVNRQLNTIFSDEE